MRTPSQIAEALVRAVTTGDLSLAGELYAEDAVLWQNTTGRTADKTRALGTIQWLYDTVKSLRYEDIRFQELPDGFVQQHRLLGEVANGATLSVDACMVVRVKDGKILRVDEYFDSAAFAVLRGS